MKVYVVYSEYNFHRVNIRNCKTVEGVCSTKEKAYEFIHALTDIYLKEHENQPVEVINKHDGWLMELVNERCNDLMAYYCEEFEMDEPEDKTTK